MTPAKGWFDPQRDATLRLRTAALEILFKSRQGLSDFNYGHKHLLPFFTERVQSINYH